MRSNCTSDPIENMKVSYLSEYTGVFPSMAKIHAGVYGCMLCIVPLDYRYNGILLCIM